MNYEFAMDRRLLVKEDGQFVWRAVRGKCLVGHSNSKGEISSGRWSKKDEDWRDWAPPPEADPLALWPHVQSERRTAAAAAFLQPSPNSLFIC